MLGVIVLVFFLCVGVAHVINPYYFLKRSGRLKGGAMLTDYNRWGFQLVGAILAIFAAGILFDILKDLVAK